MTEINAEAYFALERARPDDRGDLRARRRLGPLGRKKLTALRAAILAKLFNADTAAFVLSPTTIRTATDQDNFTADEVFPVLFEVADEQARLAILKRLLEPDFVTPVGLRTISTADSWYFPSHGFGLLGGVWPDLTLWFVVALARNGVASRTKWSIFSKRSTLRWKRVTTRATPFPDSSENGSTADRSPTAAFTSRPGPGRSICGPSPRRYAASTAIGPAAGCIWSRASRRPGAGRRRPGFTGAAGGTPT